MAVTRSTPADVVGMILTVLLMLALLPFVASYMLYTWLLDRVLLVPLGWTVGYSKVERITVDVSYWLIIAAILLAIMRYVWR